MHFISIHFWCLSKVVKKPMYSPRKVSPQYLASCLTCNPQERLNYRSPASSTFSAILETHFSCVDRKVIHRGPHGLFTNVRTYIRICHSSNSVSVLCVDVQLRRSPLRQLQREVTDVGGFLFPACPGRIFVPPRSIE